jgi:tetratricopeptide (TPR) repeat protein
MDEGKYTIRNAASMYGQQNIGDHNINIHVDVTHPVPEDTSTSLPLPTIWNIPYPRNPVFTGRQQLLTRLADTLQPGEAVALAQPQAISGLGGIGKTQLAVEYAYQHRQDYQAILWTRADTAEALIAGYGEIAHLLDLPQKDEQDQSLVVKAVQQWLKRQIGWLLILDNADDLTLVRDLLPPTSSGHLLLTTRAQTMGRLAQRIEVDTMDGDVGAVLLLRRAGLIAADASLNEALPSDIALARAITKEMGGLPLAIDQAGAYIEKTQCGLAGYQRLYQTRRAKLLALRGGLVDDHPEPVATTWSLSFEKVKQTNPTATELLWYCAHLAPDAIPEELLGLALIVEHHAWEPENREYRPGERFLQIFSLHDTILEECAWQIDEAATVLRAYSLIQRQTQEKLFHVHRLVQAVLKDQIDAQGQRQWAERVISLVNAALPPVEYRTWPIWERILPHALAMSEVIEEYSFRFAETTQLLHLTGWYLTQRLRYHEAEPILKQAFAISEQEHGEKHVETARDAATLAYLYMFLGRYIEAEPLMKQALEVREHLLGAWHFETANSLSGLAELYSSQGKYTKAEPLMKRALAICERQLDTTNPFVASVLRGLAMLYAHVMRNEVV